MQLSLVNASAVAPTGKTDATAAGDAPVQGFDALLAALLPPADAATGELADDLMLATPDAGTGVPLPSAQDAAPDAPSDAVQALLLSLPPGHALAGGEAHDPEPQRPSIDEAGASPTSIAATRTASDLPSQASARLAARTDAEPAHAHAHQASRTDAMAGQASERSRLAAVKPEPVPHSEGAPAQPRRTEQGTSLSELPSVFAAEHRASLAATELPPRQTALPVAPALHSAAWSRAFSEQVVWAARAEMQTASLTLNPPDLGPVRIDLQLDETHAMASFSSAQPEVRKAIEEALPMLKTLFADAGLNLAQADIGGGDAQARQEQPSQTKAGRDSSPPAAPAAIAAASVMARPSRGLLDTFA